MKRLLMISFVLLPLLVLAKPSPNKAQPAKNKIKITTINSQSIKSSKTRNMLIADLTKEGTLFEMDLSSDAATVKGAKLRTSAGEQTVGSLLAQLAKVNPTLNSGNTKKILIGSVNDFRVMRNLPTNPTKPPNGSMAFQCNAIGCSCTGDADCNDMFSTNACGRIADCNLNKGTCSCLRLQ